MNYTILNNYGITLNKLSNNNIVIKASSKNLSIYLEKFNRQKLMLQELINTINLALTGNTIPQEDKEWYVESGLLIYTGVIQNNLTFDLFIEDHYDETLETFPLSDIMEIMESLLEFLQS